MQVKWSEQAVSEAEGIINYIAGHNIAAALEMDDLIRQSVLILEKCPKQADTAESPIPANWSFIKLCCGL